MKLYLATFDQLIGLSILLFITLAVQSLHIAAVLYQFSATDRLKRIALPAAQLFYTLFTALEAAFVQIKTIEAGLAAFPEPLRYAPLVPVVIISAELAARRGPTDPKLSQFGLMLLFLARLPFFDKYLGEHYYTLVLITSSAVLIYSTLAFMTLIRLARSTITAATPKSIFDSMVYGALIANHRGKVLIINPAMNRIVKTLGLTEPGYVKALETELEDRAVQNQVQSTPDGCLLLSSGGNAFWFNKETFLVKNRSYQMITASEVTRTYLLMLETAQANVELEEANNGLANLVEEASQTASLAEKLRINQLAHDILGQRLTLATSSIDLAIHKGVSERKEIDQRIHNSALLLDQSLDDLFSEKEMGFQEMFQSLSDIFDLIEVKIHLAGDLPQSSHDALLGRILREAVTNAVRHGRALNIYVDITHGTQQLSMTIKNDGIRPGGPLFFNTGMEGIRQQLLKIGGRLEMDTQAEFVLKTTLPLDE